MKNNQIPEPIRIQATDEEAQAVINALCERFANIYFTLENTELKNNYDLSFVIRSTGKPVFRFVHNQIEDAVTFALAAIHQFNKIMEGEDYGYADQKNFD